MTTGKTNWRRIENRAIFMIKNYNMVREAELNYQASQKLSIEERFKIMDEMFLFARKFEKEAISPENTLHVKMLINMTKAFKRIKERQRSANA
ncbi:MAG: hypothetical protein WAX69_12840 [Victivallales bacterium]